MVRRRKSCRSVPIAPGGQPETQLRFRNRPSSVLQASMRLGEVVGQQFPKTGREEAFGPVLVDTHRLADSELFSAEEMPHEQQEQIYYPPVYIRKGTCTRITFPAQLSECLRLSMGREWWPSCWALADFILRRLADCRWTRPSNTTSNQQSATPGKFAITARTL